MSAEAKPELSVAICTRNRRDSLLRAIASLAQPASASWELLVVDNASDDGTAAACRARGCDFPAPLRVVTEEVPGLSHARNRALAEARGRVVVFVDDDVTCHPGFVDAHARAFAAPDVVAAGGRILPVLPPEPTGRWRRHLERELGGPTGRYDFGSDPADIEPGGILLPFGGNAGMVRSDALALGGFRPDLGFGGRLIPGEETALLDLLAARGRIVYVPEAVVDHHLDPQRVSFAYYRRWHRGYGRSVVRARPPRSVTRAFLGVVRGTARDLWAAARATDAFGVVRTLERAAGQLMELCDRPRGAGCPEGGT